MAWAHRCGLTQVPRYHDENALREGRSTLTDDIMRYRLFVDWVSEVYAGMSGAAAT
ncbi:hypothetical protein [Billgrantia saliphila]|uniref:hypothetical protein n=1 Tax=Billgrantia saliphila TaxID=1848458 RepID=UPI0012DEA265|nr:hypothetical protein [Halomonas saliphila]